ncbi:Gmad2 immunoglobulin-like domain-containing protein [Patescibacteria group bacterium]|nr:Gmad2 immunoglobulin-like domain-containing protein [Patescibacteria group bacterium]MBU2263518.1 Gmad2 immunoglobulin-like domain-containing protein [Patescibacteria group bacterium]
MKKDAILVIIVIVIVVVIVGVGIWYYQNQKDKGIACTMEAKLCPDGSYVARTLPDCEFAKCPEIVGIADKIVINSPKPDEFISSPVTVSGKARGFWFFEASFPAAVYDSNDKQLGIAPVQFVPQNENDTWMTENFINFKGEIIFSKPTIDTGYILFKKDNPSGLPELDESFKLPVRFILESKL